MPKNSHLDLSKQLHGYASPNVPRSIFEVTISLVLFVASYVASFYLYIHGMYAWLPLTFVLQMGALMRCFALHHECGHKSLFKTTLQNRVVGTVLGFLAFTPHYYWAIQHGIHHKTSGNLDKRGVGDVEVLTVAEFKQLSPKEKAWYLFTRHPLVIVLLGPLWLFSFNLRFIKMPPHSQDELVNTKTRLSVYLTDLFLLLASVAVIYYFGIVAYLLLVVLPVWMAGSSLITLFYIQHNFDDAYYRREEDWSHHETSLKGASYFKLPWVLNWLTANIAYHHIHHYNARIPYYKLPQCLADIPDVQQPYTIRLRDITRLYRLRLYDEQSKKLVELRACDY